EKHFILDKSIKGPDTKFSLDENEFTRMVNAIRDAKISLGRESYEITEKQKRGRSLARSLYAVEDIKKGEPITYTNVRSISPGFGLHPKYYSDILGNVARNNIERGTPIDFDDILI